MTAEPVLDIAEIVERMNRLAPRQRGQMVWTKGKVRRLLEAGGVQFIQKGPRCKLYVLLSELRSAFPQFWESLLDAESLASDDREGISA